MYRNWQICVRPRWISSSAAPARAPEQYLITWARATSTNRRISYERSDDRFQLAVQARCVRRRHSAGVLRTSTLSAGDMTASPYWSRTMTGSVRRVEGRAGVVGGFSSHFSGSTNGAGDSHRANRPPADFSLATTKSDRNWRSVETDLRTRDLSDILKLRKDLFEGWDVCLTFYEMITL